ncbi:MAG: hypothetical protein P0S96_07890 [Simkaniaceae bacterium]|nr:hypothetical protein [Candidatus Sacchlamyda saccharinae]
MLKEWCSIALVLGFLAFLVVGANFSTVRAEKNLESTPPPKDLAILVVGAVENPGEYTCIPGTALQEVLKKAGLKSSANRRKIPFKKILLADQKIEITEKKARNSEEEKISLVEKPQICYDLSS